MWNGVMPRPCVGCESHPIEGRKGPLKCCSALEAIVTVSNEAAVKLRGTLSRPRRTRHASVQQPRCFKRGKRIPVTVCSRGKAVLVVMRKGLPKAPFKREQASVGRRP